MTEQLDVNLRSFQICLTSIAHAHTCTETAFQAAPSPLTPSLEHHLSPRMGASLGPFQSLGLPETSSMVGAHGQLAPRPVHCNPSKAAAATQWQHPSHALSRHTRALTRGHICRPSRGSLSLAQGLLLPFLGFTERSGRV